MDYTFGFPEKQWWPFLNYIFMLSYFVLYYFCKSQQQTLSVWTFNRKTKHVTNKQCYIMKQAAFGLGFVLYALHCIQLDTLLERMLWWVTYFVVQWQVGYLNIICLKSPATYRHVYIVAVVLIFFPHKWQNLMWMFSYDLTVLRKWSFYSWGPFLLLFWSF